MKKKIVIIVKLLLSIAFLILVFVIITEKFIETEYISVVDEDYWVGFYGSLFGGIMGGSLTLLGVFLTIKHYKDQQEDMNRLNVKPYLKIYANSYKISGCESTYFVTKEYCKSHKYEVPPNPFEPLFYEDDLVEKEIKLKVRNVGNNSAINIRIWDMCDNKIRLRNRITHLEKSEPIALTICVKYTTIGMKDFIERQGFKSNRDLLFREYIIGFSDIIGHDYYQKLQIFFDLEKTKEGIIDAKFYIESSLPELE